MHLHQPIATSEDQVSKIGAAVREVLERGANWCATVEIADDAALWVQFNAEMINAAYPFAEHPLQRLSTLRSQELIGWKAGQYVTLAMKSGDPYAIAIWIDGYFRDVLSCPGQYRVEIKIEDLDA